VAFGSDAVHIAKRIVDDTDLCRLNNEVVLLCQGPLERFHEDVLKPLK